MKTYYRRKYINHRLSEYGIKHSILSKIILTEGKGVERSFVIKILVVFRIKIQPIKLLLKQVLEHLV